MFALGKVYTREIEEDQRLRTTANLPFILLSLFLSESFRLLIGDIEEFYLQFWLS
ncbi:hypothetical protein J2848_006065 [Azospirillum lipoferum]|nr:hypothetical protein [Azospirillum lipoferum]